MSAWMMLSWDLLARHRRIFGTAAVCFLLVCIVCPLLPPGRAKLHLAMFVTTAMGAVAMLLVASLSHGEECRLEERKSTFPVRLFTLPVSTLTLAGPPLLLGTLLLGGGWVVLALLVLRPCVPGPVAMWWPAAMIAAFMAWTQAIAWTPFPLPWLRLVVTAVALPGVFIGAILLMHTEQGHQAVAGGMAALTAVAYGVALNGVARARRGAGYGEPARETPAAATGTSRAGAAFASPARAMLWLEWRRNGGPLLGLVGLGVACALPSVHLTQWALPNLQGLPAVDAGLATVGVGWWAVAQLLIVPLLLSLSGSDMGMLSSRKNDRIATFRLVQPVRTLEIVGVKFQAAALALALAWLAAVLAGTAWATATGHIGDMKERLIGFAGSAPAAAAVLAGGLALGLAVTWLLLIGNLWGGLAGRTVVAWIPTALGMGELVPVVIGVQAWVEHPAIRPWLAVVLALGLALKAVGVVWAVRRLWARRLAGSVTLTVGLIWLVTAAACACLAWRYVGPAAAAGVVLLLPLATPLAAPLALDWARHR